MHPTLFSVSCRWYHRHLLSFPTRRSSDLVFLRRRRARAGAALRGDEHGGALEAARHLRLREQPVRSEEHTSELQSPVHLVCRRLLEKKNRSAAAETTPPRTVVPQPATVDP